MDLNFSFDFSLKTESLQGGRRLNSAHKTAFSKGDVGGYSHLQMTWDFLPTKATFSL